MPIKCLPTSRTTCKEIMFLGIFFSKIEINKSPYTANRHPKVDIKKQLGINKIVFYVSRASLIVFILKKFSSFALL